MDSKDSVFKSSATGCIFNPSDYKVEKVRFNEFYVVDVKLSADNKFIGIESIEVSQDFMSRKQKNSIQRSYDFDELYM